MQPKPPQQSKSFLLKKSTLNKSALDRSSWLAANPDEFGSVQGDSVIRKSFFSRNISPSVLVLNTEEASPFNLEQQEVIAQASTSLDKFDIYVGILLAKLRKQKNAIQQVRANFLSFQTSQPSLNRCQKVQFMHSQIRHKINLLNGGLQLNQWHEMLEERGQEADARMKELQVELQKQEKETRQAQIQANYNSIEVENAIVNMKRQEERLGFALKSLDHEYEKETKKNADLNEIVKSNADQLRKIREQRDTIMIDVEKREEQYEKEVQNLKKRKRVLDQITEEIAYYENRKEEDDQQDEIANHLPSKQEKQGLLYNKHRANKQGACKRCIKKCCEIF